MFETGQVVTTPEGNIGRIARRQSGGGSYDFYEHGGRDTNIAVYTVILDSGKVEQWTEDGLNGSPEIRRSGALK